MVLFSSLPADKVSPLITVARERGRQTHVLRRTHAAVLCPEIAVPVLHVVMAAAAMAPFRIDGASPVVAATEQSGAEPNRTAVRRVIDLL